MAIVDEGGSRAVEAGRAGRGGRAARPLAEILEGRQLLATITVNSVGDADGADGSATLSLRQAIEVSNGTLPVASLTPTQQGLVVGGLSTPDTIVFAIPGTGPLVISPTTNLPAITVPVVIDGYSQPGSSPNTNGPGLPDNAVIRVELDGAPVSPNSGDQDPMGLILSGGNSTVQGLAILGFGVNTTVVSGHQNFTRQAGVGISLRLKGGDLIRGNFIGTDATGNHVAPLDHPSVDGIDAGVAATIGGTAAADRNIISGNATGVSISGPTLVEGNFIGTDPTGARAFAGASSGTGITITGANSGTIGGTAAGAGNVISGNAIGLTIADGSSGNLVEGNLIGTDLTGVVAVSNAIFGILDHGSSSTVGGTTSAARNVISGNPEGGIAGTGSGLLIEGNFIGTDSTGSKAIPNGDGILGPGHAATIGGTSAGARNVISGNATDVAQGNSGSGINFDLGGTGNVAEGNFIGTDASGLSPLPNAGDGVLLGNPSNTIGGTAAGAGNVIAYNRQAGVSIKSSDPSRPAPNGVRVSGNSIFANGGLGIDLGGDGVTPNVPAGSPTGPNRLQPYPVLTSATRFTEGVAITGTLDAAPSTAYTVELFLNPAADPSGFGQGQTYLNSTIATTDASGHASFGFLIPGYLAGSFLSATATDPRGDTSEFARDLPAYSTTTTTTLTLGTPAPTVVGQPLTLLATVAPTVDIGTPAGQVTFTEDGQPIGTETLDAVGSAMLTITAPLGSHLFAASYAGSIGNLGSASPGVVATFASLATTTTTLIGPSSLATTGQPVTFAAVVASTSGVVPTGLVVFAENGVILGEAPLNASGVAVFFTNDLTPGPHVIAAAYTGDASDLASLSNYVAAGVLPALSYDGPTVTSATVSTPHSVTIAFNRPLLIGTAQDRANYAIVGPDGKAIAIESAAYNPADDSVILTTRQGLKSGHSYRLTIDGVRVGRVDDTHGIPLDGNRNGQPGSSFVGKVTPRGPVASSGHHAASKRSAHARK